MALVLQLTPDLEETLAAEARSRGLSLDEYVRTLIEHRPMRQPDQELTSEGLEEMLDGLAEFSDKIPDLPPEAFTRASIYRDHD